MFGVFKRNQEENKRQTEEGVKRSRERWFGRVLGLLRSSRLDDALWEELEEILISSDVGVESSMRIIEDLKSQVREGRIADPELAFERLKLALTQDLDYPESYDLWLDSDDEKLKI